MRVLSLADGLSGLRIALGAGHEYYASEVAKHAIAMSKLNYPEIVQLGDMRDIEAMPDIDLLCAGTPCNSLSISGKRTGFEGLNTLATYLKLKSSGHKFEGTGYLFWEYIRLLRQIKPKWWLLENVASMSAENRNIISRELDVEPVLINSSKLSAQSRERYYWANWPITQPADLGLVVHDIMLAAPPKYTVDLTGRTVTVSGRAKKGIIRLGEVGGNRQGYRIYDPAGKSITMSSSGGGIFRTTGGYVDKPARVASIGNGGQGERIYGVWGKSVGMKANGGGAKTGLYTRSTLLDDLESGNGVVRRLTPREAARCQTIPDDYKLIGSDAKKYRAIGNGFTIDVIKHILSCNPDLSQV